MDPSAEVEDYNDDEEMVVEDYNDDVEEEEEEMVMEDEIKIKFVFNVTPLEIIDKEDDEDFVANAAAAVDDNNNNINQVDLVIHVIDHQYIYQYWSLKSGDSPQLNSSASCHHQHHRDFHHLPDHDDNDKEMIMITCQPTCPPEVTGKLHANIGGVFASHDHQNHVVLNKDDDDEDYIMSLLNDVDVLLERGRIAYDELKELKKCITQRISEAKPAVLMAKPKAVRIRVDLSTIVKRYYANSAVAISAAAQIAIELSGCAEEYGAFIDQYPTDEMILKQRASRLSCETLDTKIFDEKDLISSSCPVCLKEFHVGVDKVQKMPCSHVFHWTCLMEWLAERNTCPLCRHELPIFSES